MSSRISFPALVTAITLGCIAAIGIAMYRLSFDVWAGIALAPVLVLLMVPLIRRLLTPENADLFPVMVLGYIVKLGGSVARYYVVFDAYGKNADAERYFDEGNALAGAVRNGQKSIFNLLPLARDARFIEHLSALVMYPLGPTRLAGFFIFSSFAYIGTVCCVRAASIAVPRLERRRYALILAFAPSLVFWPSSMGKEAWIILCVGVFNLGFAKVLTWSGRSGGLVLIVASALGMGVVRPHFAAITIGAAVIGFGFSVAFPPEPITRRRRGSLIGFLAFAVVGLAASATAAVRFLDTGTSGGDSSGSGGFFGGVSNVLNRTAEQTTQGGSSFTPINIDNPIRWPWATFRTLTRPFIFEAHNIAALIPAVETSLLLGALALGWRRLVNLPTVVRRSPYLMFALFNAFLFGLAFAAIGNLGILVRQRAIVVPFVTVLLCLPQRALRFSDRSRHNVVERSAQTPRSEPRVHATLSR